MDGFGRTIKTETGYGSTTLSVADTVYAPCGCSPLGKISQASQPHTPGGTQYWTTYTYDASGRTLSVTQPDGSATTYAYQGNTVTVTDPAGKWKKFTMDAFGNLTSVQEPDPSLGTVSTNYTYDILNNLIQASLVRGSNTQTRTFNYIDPGTNNPGAFVRGITTPENGTTTLTYNPNGTLASKTDAKGQQFTYSYDSYNRMTQIKVGGSVLRTFIFDNNTLDGSFSRNSQGRLVAVQNAQSTFSAVGSSPSAVQFTEMLSYAQNGVVSKKRLQVNETGSNGSSPLNLDAAWTYDNEGAITSVTYPSTVSYNSSTQSFSTTPGPTYTYSFDSVHRYNGLTDQNNNQLASNIQYGPSSELLSINYSGMTETRQYNNLLQLTQLTNGMANLAYNYPAASNNGKISSLNNAITGETITYQYDSLERLMSAAGSGWSQGFGYDSFGNLTSITGSNAPALSVAVNAATNQIVGQSYDANGNQLSTGAFSGAPLTYDAENRLIHAPELQYAYDSRNKRIWKGTLDSSNAYVTGQQVFFYGSNGQLLSTYALSTSTLGPSGQPYVLSDPSATPQVYFGAKRIDEIQDRLGSTIKSGSNGFFPYGEDRGTPQSGESFASYPSDSATSLSYADQRWYSSQFGRFMTADPSHSSATSPTNPRAPQSWNRYVYASGDPVNLVDPTGLDLPIDCGDDQCDGGGGDPGGGGGGCDWCGDGGGGGDGGGTPPCGPDGFLSAGCQAPPAPPPPPAAPPTPSTPPPSSPPAPLPCQVQLLTQNIEPNGVYSPLQHTSVEVDVGTGAASVSIHYDGAPQFESANPLANHGFLTAKQTIGQPYYDYANTPTSAVWSSGFSAAACNDVAAIEASALTFPNSKYIYSDTGPNSNTFSRALVVTQENVIPGYIDLQEGLNPLVVGWNWFLDLSW